MMNTDRGKLKKKSAEAALDWITEKLDEERDHLLGVGSGSTVSFAFRGLARLENFSYVPTSKETERGLKEFGAGVREFGSVEETVLDLDGADEVDPDLNLIKGGGGCHTMEKKIAEKAETLLIVVDETKIVDRIGEKSDLPVEVEGGLLSSAREALSTYGIPELRKNEGELFLTDNGNPILDVNLNREVTSGDLPRLEREINSIGGVIENGLFAERNADVVFVGSPEGVEKLRKEH